MAIPAIAAVFAVLFFIWSAYREYQAGPETLRKLEEQYPHIVHQQKKNLEKHYEEEMRRLNMRIQEQGAPTREKALEAETERLAERNAELRRRIQELEAKK